MTIDQVSNVGRLVIPTENMNEMVTALLNSGYWVKVEPLLDNKTLVLIRKDDE